jgi:hypothetical protein
MDRIQELSEFPPVVPGIDAWMASLILGTWTAFETLVSDLWVATLNVHPWGLSDLERSAGSRSDSARQQHRLSQDYRYIIPQSALAGKRTRIGDHARSLLVAAEAKGTGQKDEKEDSEAGGEKQSSKRQEDGLLIPIKAIHDITNGSYNLENHMGDLLLKRKVEFTSVTAIREAYSLAFHRKKIKNKNVVDVVDTVLSDKAIDALAEVRHVFIHKGGKADREYEEAHTKLPPGLRVKNGERIPLDGSVVKTLTDSVVECGVKLLTAIDGWLNMEKQRA